MKTKLLITGLAFMALTAIVAAQDNTRGQAQQAPRQAGSGNYVDADNNGICDYYETNRQFNRADAGWAMLLPQAAEEDRL